ncbi:MAG: hypothetical protein E6G97_16405 [Alphaproteobacteria bacterium]|nr:MAG: hypothetical protein E6G97_16405 [Alphaproteobacteria bacterium]
MEKIGDDSHVPRREDGFFDGRYAAARNINSQLGEVQVRIEQITSERSALLSSISERTDRVTDIKARAVGARVGLVAYALALAFLTSYSPSWALTLGRMVNSIGVNLTDTQAILFGNSAVAALLSCLLLWAATANRRA